MLSAAQETGLWTHGASLPAPHGALQYKTELYRQAGLESYKHFYITVNWNVNKRQNAFCGSSSAFYSLLLHLGKFIMHTDENTLIDSAVDFGGVLTCR